MRSFASSHRGVVEGAKCYLLSHGVLQSCALAEALNSGDRSPDNTFLLIALVWFGFGAVWPFQRDPLLLRGARYRYPACGLVAGGCLSKAGFL